MFISFILNDTRLSDIFVYMIEIGPIKLLITGFRGCAKKYKRL